MITLIVAHDVDRVIVNKGDIPWKLPKDMKQFKERTTGGVVVMGRKTWESIPEKYRPLPDRINIVVTSRSLNTRLDMDAVWREDVYYTISVEDALKQAKEEWPEKEVFIIGGGQIYKYALEHNLVDEIVATIVQGKHEGDTHFPILSDPWDHGVVEMEEKEFTVVRIIKKSS